MGEAEERGRDRLDDLAAAWEHHGGQPLREVWAALWAAIRRIPSWDPRWWHLTVILHSLMAAVAISWLGWFWGIVFALTPSVTLLVVAYMTVTIVNAVAIVHGPMRD